MPFAELARFFGKNFVNVHKVFTKEIVKSFIFFTLNYADATMSQVWKNKKLFLTEKIFREINSLVTSLVKTLVSRNFCQKRVRENTVWKNDTFTLSHQKIFLQTISVVIYIFSKTVTFTKLLRDMRENSSNFHTAHCGKTRKYYVKSTL